MKMRGRDPGLTCRPRDGLAVIAGARRDNAGCTLRRPERRDRVHSAADLEGTRPLKVLGLQLDGPAGKPRERLGRVDGSDACDPGDPVASSLEVSECRCLCRLQFRIPAQGSHAPRRGGRACAPAPRRGGGAARGSPPPPPADATLPGWLRRRTPPSARFCRRRSSSSPLDSRKARCSSIFSPELRHVLPAHRLGQDDRRPPLPLSVEAEDRAHLVQHRLRGGVIHLVDRDHVRDLHDPRLQGLHRVARAGHQHEQDRVRDPDHLDLALARAHGLEQDELLAGRIEQERRLQRRLGQAAEVPARAHRADEDTRIEEVVREPDPIAEQRAVRERARRIDGDHADRALLGADVADERADQRRLADARRAGDPDHEGRAGLGVELADEGVGDRVAVLDERDGASKRTAIAAAYAGRELLERPTLTCAHATASRARGASAKATSAGDEIGGGRSSPHPARAERHP